MNRITNANNKPFLGTNKVQDINNRHFMSLCRRLDSLYNCGSFTPEEKDVQRYKELKQLGEDILQAICTLQRVTAYPIFLMQAEGLRKKWAEQKLEAEASRDEEHEV